MKLKGLSQEIFLSKYAYPGETSWSERAKVIADTAASAEQDSNISLWSDRFFTSIDNGDFIPGGRIIFGSGRRKYNLLNCYVLWPEDSVESIAKIIQDTYLISCGGGGIGYDFSRIRPRGDDIQNIKHSCPGSISVMKMINEIGEHVRSGKNRRTALMAILRVDHPDLLEFLTVKLDKKQLQNFNISVAITNEFIRAVEKNSDWAFTFRNKTYNVYKVTGEDQEAIIAVDCIGFDEEDAIARASNFLKPTYSTVFSVAKLTNIKARTIWDNLFRSAVECGDPGIFNVDLANSYTNVSYFEYLPSTNPCGEVNIPSYGNCCLGHINLSNMVSETGDIYWKKIAENVRLGIRFLDNILTINHFAVSECKRVGEESRRIGLGVTGLHYFLIKAGYKYGNEKCCEFVERLYQTIRDEAYKASIELAKEKGSFPMFDSSKYLDEQFCKTLPPRIRTDIKKHGIRNAVMLTAAPCGTNSMVLGVSTGIEPIFSPIYERAYKQGDVWKTQVVTDPLFKKYYLAKDPRKLLCLGAFDVTPEEHIKMQASIQKYVDQSLSKTCNLPEDTKYEDVKDVVLDYAGSVKGFTIYRSGSRGKEPLKAISIKGLSDQEIDSIMKSSMEYGVEESSPSMCDITKGTCE